MRHWPLLSEAIDIGIFKDLNLAILDEKEIEDRTEYQMLEQGSVLNGFFSAYPSGLVYFIASQDYLYTTYALMNGTLIITYLNAASNCSIYTFQTVIWSAA